MKTFLTFVITVFTVNITIAQTYNELWAKYNIHKNICSKFSASVDINFRQQANYFSNDKNICKLPLMRSSRLWLFYNLKNNYAIVGSFFFAKTYDIKNTDANIISATETQFDIGLSKKLMLQKLENRNRLLIEKREVNPQKKQIIKQYRYRLQNSLIIPLKIFSASNKLNCVITNELFCKTQQSFTTFDQNRTSSLLQWHYHHYEYNIGFQKTYQNQNENVVTKNQLLITFVFND
jgi:hypothetical protein